MGSQHIHLLLIEDNPGDAGLIREMLAEAKWMSFELEWTETLSEGIARLALGGIDVVLLDLALPDCTGLETLQRLRAASPWAPVLVVLSGLSDEEISLQAVQEGAQDYLIKGQADSNLLVRSIRYALERGQEQEALRKAHVELEHRVRERTADLVKANEALRNSQHLLQGILDNSTAMISVKDLQGRYMLVNHRCERLFHAESESLVGKTVYDLLSREHADRVRASDQRVLASGNVLEGEELVPHDDGLHTYIVIKSPLRDAEGKPYAVCGIATDITERKRAEEKIRQSERELRHVLDLAPQHITEFGPDGSPLYNNQAALDYHGLTLEEWQGADLDTLLHPQDVERAMLGGPDKFRSGSPHEFEARLRRRDGQYRWFLFRFKPMLNEQGRVTRWYAAATDIEDRKQAEQRLHYENVALREEINKASMFEEIVGTSPRLQAVLSRVSKVAPIDSNVLITGETGTGKELVARAIHRRSQRSSRAFVSVNCAAIPRDLIASELFGHEKGSFTGATQRRIGRFELAEGGTIFLDEVGDLPAETQIALLRVLQEREFERVGGTASIRIDVRVIAATNRDLEAAIAAGMFRSDLFYRLNVFPIEMPSLRERREDIPLLVEYFIDRYARKAGKSFQTVNKRSLDLLQSYPWPGNIRELQNVIERSVIVCDTENFSVDESWLSQRPATEPDRRPPLLKMPPYEEKAIIEAALSECGGQVYGPSGAAVKLAMPRSTLESKIRSLKIDKNRFKTTESSNNN
jgi:formate hydrogenlyase transcriptional activator